MDAPTYHKREAANFQHTDCACPKNAVVRQYGNAISYCFEDVDGKLFVENGEYENQVNFCPFCGYKAKHGISE
jgi:hypothetical protein